MAQTLVSLYVHIIFSTKHRKRILLPDDEPDLYAYIGGIANNNESKLLAAGGDADHAHLLVSLSKKIGLSELVGDIKTRQLGLDKEPRHPIREVPLARWLRRIFGRIYPAERGQAIHCPSERAPRSHFIPGRV